MPWNLAAIIISLVCITGFAVALSFLKKSHWYSKNQLTQYKLQSYSWLLMLFFAALSLGSMGNWWIEEQTTDLLING